MFGAKPTFSFGSGSATFGASTAAPFGSGNTSTFGNAANKSFGQTPSFGTQTPSTGGTSLFGQQTTSQGPSLFGQQNTGGFGSTQSSGFTFGATPTANTGGNLFGQQNTTQTSGLFASPVSNTSFGAKTPGFGGFGTTNTSTAGALFGTNQQNTSLFGNPGASAGFGQAAPNGTTVKFNPPTSQDTMVKNGVSTNINTRHQCITAMKEYQSKSLEELRVEDYLANRKGKQTATAFATPSASSAFNATPASTGTSLFGQQQQQQNNTLFGQSKSLFGASTATGTSGFSGFGTTTSTQSLFGQQNQQTKPLFGATPSTQASGFGTTSAGFGSFGATSSGFGTTNAAAGSSLFNTKPAFGATTTTVSGFGAPASNLFAKPTTGPSLFGNTSQPSTFGTSGGFSFGNTGAIGANSGVFGAKPTSFGNTSTFNLGQTSGFNLNKPFGASTGMAGFGPGFGLNTSLSQGGATTTLSTSAPHAAPVPNEVQIKQQLMALASSPYGDSPLFWNLKPSDKKREEILKPTNPSAQKAVLSNQFKVSARPTAKIKPKSLHNMLNGSKTHMFEGLEDDDFSGGNESFMPKKSIKKLVIRKGNSNSSSPSRASSVLGESENQSINEPEVTQNGNSFCLHDRLEREQTAPEVHIPPKLNIESFDDTISQLNVQKRVPITSKSPDDTDLSLNQTVDESIERPTTPPPRNLAGIVLTRPGYYTIPSVEEVCEQVDENGDCFVDDFTVGREGYGNIFFHGPINVANLNLDDIVHIRRKEVIVYPDDDNKPPEGEELNRKAEITLDCVWPTDKTTRSYIKDPERLKTLGYHEKMEEITARIGGRFLDYRPETGSWVFEVKHFTKYGLEESDEEDLSALAQLKATSQKLQKNGKPMPPSVGEKKTPKLSVTSDIPAPPSPDTAVPMTEDDIEGLTDINQETVPDSMVEDYMDESSEDVMDDQPSSHRLAQSMGVSAHNMQVMKASFFQEEEAPPNQGAFPPRIVTPEPIRPTKSKFHMPPVDEHLPLPSGMKSDDLPRRIVGSRIPRPIPDFQESAMYDKQDVIVDAALFHGRSFRVGWGPGWTLVHPGVTIAEQVTDAEETSFSVLSSSRKKKVGPIHWNVLVEKLDVTSYFKPEDPVVVGNHEELLSIQLENSRRDVEEGCPVFAPVDGEVALQHIVNRVKQDKETSEGHPDFATVSYLETLWNLCAALFGNLPDDKINVYEKQHARREAVSNWLSSTAGDKIKKEIQAAKYKGKNHLPSLFAHLTGRQVAEACSLSQRSGDTRLALVMSQCMGSYYPKQLLDKQLNEWAELGAYKFIEELRLKLYAVLAGRLVWQTPETTVNTCMDLDWKRAFALHLWYMCPPTSPAQIHKALKEYEMGFCGDSPMGMYCNPPLPPYLEDIEMGDTENIQDTAYHLLKLYCQNSYPLESLFNPMSHTANQMDYRFSWHLHQVLQSVEAQYSHLSDYHRACLHLSFAAQLESVGMWEWAVFVVLHLRDCRSREWRTQDLLSRYVSVEEEFNEQENFIQEKLDVPVEWIHYAKALKARYTKNPHAEAVHLLKSRRWNECHKVILKYLSSDAIINEDNGYLYGFLVELAPPDRCNQILDWCIGGQVLLDYLKLVQNLEQLKLAVERDSVHHEKSFTLESLRSDITSLCERISNLPCYHSRDRLCQAEISKRLTVLFRTILSLQDEHDASVRFMAPQIGRLPMPEDYKLQALAIQTRDFSASFL
ncbi:nuclear pore complex protein Nup98-Nup96-like isoform X2 [Ostrea edulis]|uniref:nuclear pore complex protein Nup98-Nup96-like isoform X2 n=1 Tax=Ostrea edulis TaxID=37623 RepID=UPI0024AF804F|nr:nuclear pore complex protein Nup98-Nup96-like isoform X2 [Ostrea edulis]